jgi:predicted phosphodiesterase
MAGKTQYWTDERIAALLATAGDSKAMKDAFPDKRLENLRNRYYQFKQDRVDLLPASLGGLAGEPTYDAPEGTPPGWKPSVEQTATEVKATTQPRPAGQHAEDAELLEMVGLDPSLWTVASVRRSKWQQREDGDWLEAYKVSAVRRTGGVDVEELVRLRDQVSLLDPVETQSSSTGEGSTFVVCLADWQIGKGERGGSEATVERIEQALSKVVVRIEELRAAREVDRIALVGLGDLFEGCSGFYAMQEWQTDLTRREQVNVVRRVILRWLRRLAQVGLPIVVTAVGGNHGENRKRGKSYTTFGDNEDVAVFEQVADVVSESPEAFGNPTFSIPGDALSVAIELSGVNVGIVHGHQFGSGPNRAMDWWQKQSLAAQPVGAAQILLSGHFHNLDMRNWGTRTHIQCPSMDGGSQWYRERHGVDTPPGVVTLLVGSYLGPLGWSDLQVL